MNLNEIITGKVRDPFTGDLYEGLISSVEPKKAINFLENNLNDIPGFNILLFDEDRGVLSFIININYPSPTISRIFNGNIVDPNVQRIIKLVNNIGYFIASYIFDYEDNFYKTSYTPTKFRDDFFSMSPKNIIFTIERKYDKVVTSLPKFLYHITNKAFITKIQNKGLIPRSGNKQSYHPERIYFTKDKDDMNNFSDMLSLHIPKKDQLLLTIDTENISNTFYNDPNLSDAIYTYQNISPKDIVSYDIID